MTLENLLGRALESIPKDPANVERLMAAARRSLEDSEAVRDEQRRGVLRWRTNPSCKAPTQHFKQMDSVP